MLAACRLAGLSALEAHYDRVNSAPQAKRARSHRATMDGCSCASRPADLTQRSARAAKARLSVNALLLSGDTMSKA